MGCSFLLAGLFSASLTAFIIESYKTLTPDQGDATVAILMQISRQLSTSGNASAVQLPPVHSVFRPSAASITCNTLWFISLGLSLSCALIATLVEQWARDFIQKTDMRPSPIIRARIFSYLYYGIRRFNMHAVVELIPLLLHISLILFFAGLVAFFQPINGALMVVASALLFIIVSVYGYLTVLPVLHSDCPYHTPLSVLLRDIVLQVPVLWAASFKQKQELGSTFPAPTKSGTLSLSEVMTNDATRESPERADRDCRALIWTMKALTDDDELELFVEALPDVIWGSSGPRHSYDEQIHALLRHPDVCLIPRLEGLLRSCDGGLLPSAHRQRRQIACLKAIWAITHMTFDSEEPFYGFDFDLFVHVENFDATVQPYLVSTKALARFNFASWYERERHRVKESVNNYRNQMGTDAPRLTDLKNIVSMFENLESHSKNSAGVVKFDPDADYWDHYQQLPAAWMSNRGRAITPSSSAEVRQWLDRLSVTLKRLNTSLTKIFCNFIQVASDLDSPPYELRSTCNAMLGDSLHISKTDMMTIDSTFRHITSPRHLYRLKKHRAVHHIDVIAGILISLWQTCAEDSRRVDMTMFSESLLRYIGSRDIDESLVVSLGSRCDHNLLSLDISANLRRRWWPADDFKFLWRLCAFYLGLDTTPGPRHGLEPLALSPRLPSGFDRRTVIAVKDSAPSDILPSVVAVLEILILRSLPSQSFPATGSLLGWRAWMEERCETYWLILTEFLEQCCPTSLSLPYKAAETMAYILGDSWRPQKVGPLLQRRFATGLLGLVQRDSENSRPHIELFQQLVDSFVFKWYTPEAVSQTTFKFDDPTAGGLVINALDHFINFASEDVIHDVRLIISNLQQQHRGEKVEAEHED
ncbi:hypothetical protein B0H11DRAFT_366366 [Mycena galericulata]|nr:hypothetical protein B0H11DRAFT_366366 [Mycena galericulata]